MLASNSEKLMPNNKIPSGWHDVIQLDESLVGEPCARWAIVDFIDAHGVQALPRTETHKWHSIEIKP